MTKIPLCRHCSGQINPIWLWQKQVQCPYYTRTELHLLLGLSLAHHIPHFWAQSPELRILFFFLFSLAPRSQVHVLIGSRINGLLPTLKQTDFGVGRRSTSGCVRGLLSWAQGIYHACCINFSPSSSPYA